MTGGTQMSISEDESKPVAVVDQKPAAAIPEQAPARKAKAPS